ncbi:Invasion-inducing protein TIAM1/CDC24 and related RhoGEF GTPases [Phaffia rhodozyma]|uniref:Invasion-inducing protein TIAM1/CDC24 and related RhoGEF GTPases n=1 Tax=Phaffia rhodozyma TaxID=264483 RepID=A0A0F7SET9_PHARH|nr:Invasion-inducing protein TIAM1/CDC24 and related RhoGEF GTPases [Phaffia rhodozyma]
MEPPLANWRPTRPPYPSSDPVVTSPPTSFQESQSGSIDEREDDQEGQTRKKQTNPLIDLIETEKRYVEELGGVIKKVAAAWSRTNFPPQPLDSMFRAIEGIYKINRAFGTNLKEIGPNPSSPKALGDLLMRWIDDMEPAYSRYATCYLTAFDTYAPVQSNPNLAGILTDISQTLQEPPPSISPDGAWTLDCFFVLPYNRLRYYKKLYSRLLKSTQPGRSDHGLLVGANDRLNALLEKTKSRLDMTVDGGKISRDQATARASVSSSGGDSSRQSGASAFSVNGRSSGTSTTNSAQGGPSLTSVTTLSPVSSSAPQIQESLLDIERRLSTERTVDLFTMNPRMVRLQISPPALPFQRLLRRSLDVHISFTPKTTGQFVEHRRGHVFVLSDLFLICEWMEPNEAQKAEGGSGKDMWLCYPPLAGKHLQVFSGTSEDTIDVLVMKRETFTLRLESSLMRGLLMRDFQDCIEFASSVSLAIQTKSTTSPTSTSPNSFGLTSPGAQNPHVVSPLMMSPSSSISASQPAILSHVAPLHQRERMLSSALSQESTYSNNSSSHEAPSLSQQIGAMELGGPPTSLGLGSVIDAQQQGSLPDYNRTTGGPLPPLPPPQRGTSLRIPNHQQQRPQQPTPSGGVPPLSFAPAHHAHAPYTGGPGVPQQQQPLRQPQPQYPASSAYPNRHNSNPPGGPEGGLRPLQMAGSRSQPNSMYVESHPPPQPSHLSYPQHQQQRNYLSPQGPSGGPLSGGHGHQHGGADGEGRMSPGGYDPNIQRNIRSVSPVSRSGSPTHQASLRSRSTDPHMPVSLPSAAFAEVRQQALSSGDPSLRAPGGPHEQRNNSMDISPPPSPGGGQDDAGLNGPAVISAQMKCKVFLKRDHAQWKSLGSARLKLFHQQRTNVKQVVVESESGSKAMLISTIVLTDGVERVGKTGVAVEISDQGRRTGIVYMIQLRNEASAVGLFDSLLMGTNRGKP